MSLSGRRSLSRAEWASSRFFEAVKKTVFLGEYAGMSCRQPQSTTAHQGGFLAGVRLYSFKPARANIINTSRDLPIKPFKIRNGRDLNQCFVYSRQISCDYLLLAAMPLPFWRAAGQNGVETRHTPARFRRLVLPRVPPGSSCHAPETSCPTEKHAGEEELPQEFPRGLQYSTHECQ